MESNTSTAVSVKTTGGYSPRDLPVYYRPGSHLGVQSIDSTTIREFTVIRPIVPFTMAQVLVVRETFHNEGEEMIMKVYDPRFMSDSRRYASQPWNLETERAAVELRRAKGTPSEVYPKDLPYIREVEGPVQMENYIWLRAQLHFTNEVRAYTHLKPLQGKGIPQFLGHGKLTSATIQTDPQRRLITPSVLLLEFIPNACTVKEADPALLRPDLIRSLIDTVSQFRHYDVIHGDHNSGNYLFTPGRAIVIDFGMAYFRDEGQSDEAWDKDVRFENDLYGVKLCVAQKLDFDVVSLDEYLTKNT